MPSLSGSGANWLITLSTSFTFSLFGLLVPNFYKQTKKPRAHNKAKLLNEFLGRHQILYVTYFLAIALTAEFIPQFAWVKKLITLGVGVTLLCYLLGVYLTVHQDDFFRRHHRCSDDDGCVVPVSKQRLATLIWPNAFTTTVLLAIAIVLAFIVQ
jgi:hypothetical protein